MHQEQLDEFKTWLRQYVAGFYGEDPCVNAGTKVKEDHTWRTCDEITSLAGELGLDANQRLVAQTVALLHDVGRFPQFAQYRTYNDAESVDHSLLGVEILRQQNVLSKLEQQERQLIETAIQYHGRKQLPPDLNGQALLFAKLLRDADKLDVLHIVTEEYGTNKASPDEVSVETEPPHGSRYSGEIVRALLAGQLIEYNAVRTLNDMKLCQVGWVYDVNFAGTLRRIRQRRFLEKIFASLPVTADIEQVKARILTHLDQRIRQGASS